MSLTPRQRLLAIVGIAALVSAIAALWWQGGVRIFAAGLGGTLC